MCMTNLSWLCVNTSGMFLSCTLPPRLSRITVSSMSSMFSYVHTFKLTYRRISVKQLILFTSHIHPMLDSVGKATHQPKSVPSDPSASAQAGHLMLYAAGFVPNGALYRFIITSDRRTTVYLSGLLSYPRRVPLHGFGRKSPRRTSMGHPVCIPPWGLWEE